MRHLLLVGGLLCGAAALPAPLLADVTFTDFSSTSGLNLLGSAAQAGNRLRMTPGVPNQAGAAWYTTRQLVTAPFATEFRFRMTGGAEGMTFAIQQDDVGAIGGFGEQLGYHGMLNSFVVELDAFRNLTVGDPNGNHISVHNVGAGPVTVNEAASLGATTLLPLFSDGFEHVLRIEYVPGTMRIFLDDLARPALQLAVDLGATLNLPDDRAWVGFTASTGMLTQTHEVISWTFLEDAFTPTGNHSPAEPTITEPQVNGQVVNPFDVHLETSAFSDVDPGDSHLCTDWEIWTMQPVERVWRTHCIGGLAAVHSHLGDGIFEGSHAGMTELRAQEAYVLQVRHRDDSGDPLTDWSPWAERSFQTGAASQFFPYRTEDVVEDPAPTWNFAASQTAVVLPAGAPQPSIQLESATGQLLLSIAGFDGVQNQVTNPPELPQHVDVRVRVEAGDFGGNLVLAESDLTVVGHDCVVTRILLPALDLAPFETAYFWVTSDGSTWVGSAGQTEPVFDTLARGLALPWAVHQPGYQVEVVATGLQLPVNIAFVPNPGPDPGDPFLYVTELYGTIKVVSRDGTVGDYATGLLNYSPTGNFPGSGEQGLTGIAVDPLTGDVFANMLYDASGPHYPKVVRFTSLDGGLTAATQTTILDMAGEPQGQSHQISHLELHPDGKLICHMGDGFSSATAQNLASFRGKILRLNLDGTAPTDNPFYDPGNGITSEDYVWAYGVRNPFGGRRRASDGFHYEVENGPSIDRFAKVVPGTNYLWNGSNSSMLNLALYNWQPSTGPVNLAFVEPGTFGGSGFPRTKWDHAFVTESGPTYASGPQANGKRITEYVIDAAGNLVSGPEPFVEYAGTGKATAVGLAAGPDGLYFTDLYADQGSFPSQAGANLLRVSFRQEVDCNNNGVPDPCDIAAGTSEDLNDNGVPDECEALGTSYCGPAVPNSTGVPARLRAFGSGVAGDPLPLHAADLPPNQFGYFLTSQTPGFVFQPGGSQGNLCLSGTIGRFARPGEVQNAGAGGHFMLEVDTLDLPTSPPAAAVSGETWNFQAWFRDANPGDTSNFTDGVALTFL